VRAEVKADDVFWTELDVSLVRRVFIENCAESVFVVAKPPAMRFGEGSDSRFALAAITHPKNRLGSTPYSRFLDYAATEHARQSKNDPRCTLRFINDVIASCLGLGFLVHGLLSVIGASFYHFP
jgi:hypothetical protein